MLRTDGQAWVLEHSDDDGQHWIAIGRIGADLSRGVALAVYPAQPGSVCAAHYGETSSIELLSSVDGGMTWRAGTMPSGYDDTSGETSYNPQMDAHGTCY